MKKSFILLFVLLSGQLLGQLKPEKIKIGLMAGYAFFQQDDLKSINHQIQSQLPFEAQIIDNFDPVFYFGGYAQYELFNHFYMGPVYEYRYTGSRLGTKDYSGRYSFDQYGKAHQIGLKFDYSLLYMKQIVLNAQLSGGASFTDWKMDSNLEVGEDGDYSEHQVDKFKGHGWYVSPGISFGYRLIPQVTLIGSATYSFDIAQRYKYLMNTAVNVINNPDWSGIKLSLGIEFNLNNLRKD